MMRLTWLIEKIMDWICGGQGFPCLFHLLTGFYCPGCGGTRAIRLMLQGHWLQSLQYHPFVLYVLLGAAAEGMLFLWSLAGKRHVGTEKADRKNGGNTRGKTGGISWRSRYLDGFLRRYPWWVSIGAGIVLINWIVKNIFLAMGIDLLPPLL